VAYWALMFTNLGLQPALLRAVADLNFTEPTEVQAAAIPPAIAGRAPVLCSARSKTRR